MDLRCFFVYLFQVMKPKANTGLCFTQVMMLLMITAFPQGLRGQATHLVHPSTYVVGVPFPVVLEMELASLFSNVSNGTEILLWQDDQSNGLVQSEIKHGRTSAILNEAFTGTVTLDGLGVSSAVSAESTGIVSHSGAILTDEIWLAGSVHHITGDLSIGTGVTLTIDSGVWVIINGLYNIVIDGSMIVSGESDHPVTLSASTGMQWGGIIVNENGYLNASNAFMIGGGADQSLAFGHSDSQAVVKVENGSATLNQVYLLDNVGKGIGASGGSIQFHDGLIQRCDMGGEFHAAFAQISRSHILDIPNDDGIEVDDDNDGLYFNGVVSGGSGPSLLDSCVFHTGKDDGIDHNGANLNISSCVIANFENEGIAASNGYSISVYNTLVRNCEQGIEAGYGFPQVELDHCVMFDNEIGLRFGDWYDWGCAGQITCTNSIMSGNIDNILNFDVLSNGPVANAIDVSYSLTNDGDYDAELGCLAGAPLFSSSFQLENGSIGIGAADDNSNMGLVGSSPTGIEPVPYHSEYKVTNGRFTVTSVLGSTVMRSAYKQDLIVLAPGLYVLTSLDIPGRSTKISIVR